MGGHGRATTDQAALHWLSPGGSWAEVVVEHGALPPRLCALYGGTSSRTPVPVVAVALGVAPKMRAEPLVLIP
ncbi:MAG: hypothetical protein QOG10_1707 [Kribbellaceae bacterium]|nr:hypothetical protein [Kribbellaceae bacterium]